MLLMNRVALWILAQIIFLISAQAVPPVLNYAGQVAVNGEAFDGNGLFKFALVNAEGSTTYWSNDGTSVDGSEPQASVAVSVNGGLYAVLLGNTAQQGMAAIDPVVFAQHTDAKLRVWFSNGVNGFQQLYPDRPFASVPYAFSAGTAQSTTIADGSINKSMLGNDVIADLNATIGINRLSAEVTAKLDQNGTGGSGIAVGSIISLPIGQSAPAGYSLYQLSEQSWYWQEMSPYPGEAMWLNDGVVEVEGEIYLVAGYGTSRKDTLLKFNPQTDKWVSLAPLDFARDRVASAVLNGRIYLIGGYDGTSKLKDVDVYDPATNSWNSAADLPEAIERSTAESFNGKIYLIGGTGDKVYSYDPSINIWSEEANMTKNINGGSSCIFNGRIWLAKEKDALSYDPILKEWKTETSFNLNKGQPAMWTHEGSLFAGGGPQNDLVEKFSIETQQWEIYGKLPYMVSNAKAFVVQHHLYLVSGNVNPTGLSNKVFVVDLDEPTNGLYDLYRKDGDAPVGTPVVQSEYADGSVTTSKLDATILKYLKPEIASQPQAQTVYEDSNVSFSVTAEGKYLTYQWKKDGVDLNGETNATLNIIDANATLHDGNYSLVVSNDFGSVKSGIVELKVSSALLNGLVGWWKFDEGSGTVAYDSSGNGNDGNLTNGPTWITGKIGGALSFDGVDDVIIAPLPNLNTSNISTSQSAWIKTGSSNTKLVISTKRIKETYGWPTLMLRYGKGSIEMDKSSDRESFTGTQSVNDNAWHFICGVKDQNKYSIYVDGSLSKSGTNTHSYSANDSIWIGNHGAWNEGGFVGLIDDVRIYDRALSAEEVQALYNLGQ